MCHSTKAVYLPSDWKKAIAVPIFKKKDPHSAAKYRPVNLISVVCKILERVIRQQLIDYLDRNNILPKQQQGFLS